MIQCSNYKYTYTIKSPKSMTICLCLRNLQLPMPTNFFFVKVIMEIKTPHNRGDALHSLPASRSSNSKHSDNHHRKSDDGAGQQEIVGHTGNNLLLVNRRP